MASLNGVIMNIESRIGEVALRKKGLILHLNELSAFPLEVEFLPGHPNYGSNTFNEKYKTVIDISNAVMASLVETAMQTLFTVVTSNINVFINNSVSNTELIVQRIHDTAALHCARVTSYTLECILALIKVQNCDRESNHLRELLWRRNMAVPLVRKVLKIVVTCREVPCAGGSCGICFEEMIADNIVKTGCNHDFCVDCISSWAKQRGLKSFIQCPSCRTEINDMTVGNHSEQVKLEQGLR